MTALFRNEVMEAKKNAWLGPMHLVQPFSIKLIAAVSGTLLCTTILFAIFGTYTRRVHATGVLLPKAGLITLASPAAGVVTTAAVKEGDKVAKGALLYILDLDTHSSKGATEQQVIAQLIEQKANLEKQRALRLSMAKVEKQTLQDQRANLENQYKQLAQQIAIQNSAVTAMKAKADQLQRGVKAGFVADPDFQSQNYLYIQSLAEGAQFQQTSLQVRGRITDIDGQLAMFDDKLAQDVNQIDGDVLHVDELLAESQARRSIEIRAPEEGTATSIRVHAGQQVSAGSPLVTLLPRAGDLEVNLFVDSAAIGFIEKDAPVVLRYAAYPFQRYGLYRGRVKEATRAPVDTSLPGGDVMAAANALQNGEAVYRILVTPQTDYVSVDGRRKSLEAGMRVDADIALEKRPLYRWLFDPLYHLQRSVRLVSNGG
jgi:membrane fusion protein